MTSSPNPNHPNIIPHTTANIPINLLYFLHLLPRLLIFQPHLHLKFSAENHTSDATKPCKSTPKRHPHPSRIIQTSSHTLQLISLSIYSTSYTSFPVYSSSNPIFISKTPPKITPPTPPNHVNLHLNDLPTQPKSSKHHPTHYS